MTNLKRPSEIKPPFSLISRCSRLGLVSISYLWRRDQDELFDEMIDAKVEAILIKVAMLGLDNKHLGLSFRQVRDDLHKMVIIMIIIRQ